jgi:hypothetical protein
VCRWPLVDFETSPLTTTALLGIESLAVTPPRIPQFWPLPASASFLAGA